MENKPNFKKDFHARIILQKFLIEYMRGGSISDVYNYLTAHQKDNKEKIKIIKNCKKLFEDAPQKDDSKKDKTPKAVDIELATFQAEIKDKVGRNPTAAEITNWLLECFSEEIYGIDKRTYDMSKIATKDMLCKIRTKQGSIFKVVTYVSFEEQQKKHKDGHNRKPPEIALKDRYGNPIRIRFMGCLAYRTPSCNQYIYKHHITMTIDGVEQEFEKYSNIDIFAMNYNQDLCNLVVSELLSKKNITKSNADDYIGETSEQSSLEPGTEKIMPGFYIYQVSPDRAIIYNGERIEAIRAYKEQEAFKETSQQTSTPKPSQADDAYEL